MIKRKPKQEPFKEIKIEKRAYDLSESRPEDYRKEIMNYMQSLHPFLAKGLRHVNYKKQPDDSGNAIGFVEYENGGVVLTIPIIIDEKNLKEPTIAIYNNHVVPLDKEYLDYIINEPEYGTQINESELPGNMQYVTQSGLFQENDSGVYKRAEKIAATIFREDPANPYHYKGIMLKRASDNSLSIEDGVYCTASEMLGYIKETDEMKAALEKRASIGADERLVETPMVQKITDSGVYRNVMMNGEVISAHVRYDVFNVDGSKSGKSIGIINRGMQEFTGKSTRDTKIDNSSPEWAYGDAYGSGYEVSSDMEYYRGNPIKITPDECAMNNIVFSRPYIVVNKQGYDSDRNQWSEPMYVDQVESMQYGDDGEMIKIMRVITINDKKKHVIILTDKVGEISEVDNEKLKSSMFKNIMDGDIKTYLYPMSYPIMLLGPKQQKFGDYKEEYRKLVSGITKEYPNKLSVINKGANQYVVNVRSSDNSVKHEDVSGDAALLLTNYYLGKEAGSINEYSMEAIYDFKGDVFPRKPNRDNVHILKKAGGEYRNLAKALHEMPEEVKKVAEIENVVNDLLGIDASLDDEHVDTANVLKMFDNVISKLGEMLLMARLGKNEISESMLSRALYAMTKMSNELRGFANTNAR